MEIIEHKTISEDSTSWHFMDNKGMALAKAHIFKNDEKMIVLSELSVIETARNKGLGTKFQQIRENLGRSLGCNESFLWVLKGSWMQEWYARRGYKYHSEKEDEENNIWMVKKL